MAIESLHQRRALIKCGVLGGMGLTMFDHMYRAELATVSYTHLTLPTKA